MRTHKSRAENLSISLRWAQGFLILWWAAASIQPTYIVFTSAMQYFQLRFSYDKISWYIFFMPSLFLLHRFQVFVSYAVHDSNAWFNCITFKCNFFKLSENFQTHYLSVTLCQDNNFTICKPAAFKKESKKCTLLLYFSRIRSYVFFGGALVTLP